MAEVALDAVCSRKEQSSDSSYHKGLEIRASVLRTVLRMTSTYPHILHTKRPSHCRLSNTEHCLLYARIPGVDVRASAPGHGRLSVRTRAGYFLPSIAPPLKLGVTGHDSRN